MSIRITCPGCETPLTLADTMAGKKVRCTSCKKVLAIPASKKKVLAGGEEPDEDEAIQEDEKPQVKAKSHGADDDADGDDDEDRPKKKKKKKKKGKQGNLALIVGGVSVGVVLLLVGGAVALVFALMPDAAKKEAEKKHAQQMLAELKNKDANGNPIMKDNVKDQAAPPMPVQPQGKDGGGFRIIPKIQDGNPNAKKGGDNIVSSIRGSGYRLERQNELSNIGKSYIQYYDDFKGANRNMTTWLQYIKTFGPIREAVVEGYYKMNFNATLDGGSVIAYERDIDKGTHLCVRGSGQVEYVPVAELKAILGRDP